MKLFKQKNLILPVILMLIAALTGFEKAQSQSFVKDVEGNIYPVVKIGNSEWMAQNLRVKHNPGYNPIESWSIRKKNVDCELYGRLYTWDVAMDGANTPGSRGICPEGWHIPTDKEWSELIDALGGPSEAGSKMQGEGVQKFNVVFAGNYNSSTGQYSFFDQESYYWSSDEYMRSSAWMRNIHKENGPVNHSAVKKYYGFSLRCVKDP